VGVNTSRQAKQRSDVGDVEGRGTPICSAAAVPNESKGDSWQERNYGGILWWSRGGTWAVRDLMDESGCKHLRTYIQTSAWNL
jgi:hypothetical protein